MSCDYTTVGHVTADVTADGSRRPGGGAFYSALQAARLGWRARIVTRGVGAEIEQLLAPYREELELELVEAPCTTTLATSTAGRSRSQRMLAWAGEIGEEVAVDTTILHLAPVARETPARWRGRARFVGLTPQGLVRTWSRPGAAIVPAALALTLLPERCDAVVLSSDERESCAALLAGFERGEGERHGGRPVIAVTDAAAPTELFLADGESARVRVRPVRNPCDDLGAGDVFAAAFFVALVEGSSPLQAASFANAAAAVRIAGRGPGAIGDRAAVEARLDTVD
ncbi:MAG TPA: PfkB family carbohydrate kinase [Solirubrobacteraceae bacterium]|nr:PfkB family carbohydrate kinase [Solirubrobacteraceae bacterium]